MSTDRPKTTRLQNESDPMLSRRGVVSSRSGKPGNTRGLRPLRMGRLRMRAMADNIEDNAGTSRGWYVLTAIFDSADRVVRGDGIAR